MNALLLPMMNAPLSRCVTVSTGNSTPVANAGPNPTGTGSLTQGAGNATYTEPNLHFKSNLVVPTILGIVAQAHLMAQAAGTFIPTGNMTTARANHTATLLLDGRV